MFCHRQRGCACIKILWARFCYEITWIDLAFWLQICINTDTPLVSAAFIVLLTLHDTNIFWLYLESNTVFIEKSILILVYTARNSVYEHIHTSIISEVSSTSVIITSATIKLIFFVQNTKTSCTCEVNNYQKLFRWPFCFCFILWKED